MIHISDGSSLVSLNVPYATADIPAVLGAARGVLASSGDTVNPIDVLEADQRIGEMVQLVAYRLNLGVAEVALSTLLKEANLQHGGTLQETEGGHVFTDISSCLAEQALRGAVWQRMLEESV